MNQILIQYGSIKNLFLRSYPMNSRNFFIVSLIAISLVAFGQTHYGIPTGLENVSVQNLSFEREVLSLVNKIRKDHNLNPLLWQEDLARAARYHAQDMALDDYMEHATYDRANKTLIKICGTFQRIEKFKGFPYLAENISAGKPTAKETFDGWMKSSGHRTNILNPNFKYLGVGYFFLSNSTYQHYWVQDFGG